MKTVLRSICRIGRLFSDVERQCYLRMIWHKMPWMWSILQFHITRYAFLLISMICYYNRRSEAPFWLLGSYQNINIPSKTHYDTQFIIINTQYGILSSINNNPGKFLACSLCRHQNNDNKRFGIHFICNNHTQSIAHQNAFPEV